MPVSTYIPHLLYSTALASLSFHLLFQKKQADVDRAHLTAQISILESLKQQLQSKQGISDEELQRLYRLSKTHDEVVPIESNRAKSVKIGWKDVFFGRKMEDDGGVREAKAIAQGTSCFGFGFFMAFTLILFSYQRG